MKTTMTQKLFEPAIQNLRSIVRNRKGIASSARIRRIRK